jgi:hypothetical protein
MRDKKGDNLYLTSYELPKLLHITPHSFLSLSSLSQYVRVCKSTPLTAVERNIFDESNYQVVTADPLEKGTTRTRRTNKRGWLDPKKERKKLPLL